MKHIWPSIASTIVLLILCCGIYPVVVWGISQAIFPGKANGSLITKDGTSTIKDQDAVGSALLGQNFLAAGYFHPRPSAAGNGYDATSSGGTNLGPLSDKLINGQVSTDDKGNKTVAFDGIRVRTLHYAIDNGISFKTNIPLDKFKDAHGNLDDVKLVDAFHDANNPLVLTDFSTLIPGDAVTASGSGLDPHISPANAELQKNRVAAERGIKAEQVEELITAHTDGPDLGILGDPGVNVLMLNLALDDRYPLKR
jgi:K+-transporting ATPase ATPase C chain